MSKLLTTICAVLLLATFAQAFRSGIVKIYGNQRNKNPVRCAGEGEFCITDSGCCPRSTCSYVADGSNLYGQCKEQSVVYDGKPCGTDYDCGNNYCCQMETVGYRGYERRVCRSKSNGCSMPYEPAPAVDPGYYRYYKWRTMRRRGRKRSLV